MLAFFRPLDSDDIQQAVNTLHSGKTQFILRLDVAYKHFIPQNKVDRSPTQVHFCIAHVVIRMQFTSCLRRFSFVFNNQNHMT